MASLGVMCAILVLDPGGEYFGVSSTFLYGATFGLVTLAAGVRLIVSPKPSRIGLAALAGMVFAIGLSRAPLDDPESAIRVFLVPYTVACALVAAPDRCAGARLFVGATQVVGLFVGASLLAWYFVGYLSDMDQLYHEEVFLLAPVAAARMRRRWLCVAVLMFVGAASFASNKFTGFIVLALSAGVVVWRYLASGVWRKPRYMLATVAGALLLLSAAVLLVFHLAASSDAPTGSVDVRQYTYGLRWTQFLQGPMLGGAATGTSGVYVLHKQFTIPSHSDLLDILAFAGILGMFVFAIPVVLATARSIKRGRLEIVALLLAMLATAAFNPFLYQAPFLALFACAIYFGGVRHGSS